MNTHKKTARIVGALFPIAIVASPIVLALPMILNEIFLALWLIDNVD